MISGQVTRVGEGGSGREMSNDNKKNFSSCMKINYALVPMLKKTLLVNTSSRHFPFALHCGLSLSVQTHRAAPAHKTKYK